MTSKLIVNSIRHTGASGDAVTLANDGTCTANITNNLSNRNKIINGAMAISQRRTQRTGTGGGDGYFLCDRWRIFSANTSARFTISQAQDTSGASGLPYSYKFDCTTADTNVGTSDILGLQQRIEGQDVQDFLKGTSSAKKFTLSFYVKTNKSGVYTVELRDNNNIRQCSKTFTVSNSNWNRYTVSFPADTTGAFNNNNNDSLQVNFWLIAGSSYTSGTLNTSGWASITNANRVSSSNVNIGDSTSNNFELTGVQLEVDQTGSGVATDFEHRSFGQEIALCERYYYRTDTGGTATNLVGLTVEGATTAAGGHSHPTRMRATPTITLGSGTLFFSSATGVITPSLHTNRCSKTHFAVLVSISGATAGQSGTLYRNDANGYIEVSAEL